MSGAVRTPLNSPFAPGSDHVPEVWAGRQPELADFETVAAARRLAGVYERGRAVLGEPGIGKSVLVNRIARMAKTDGHWVTPPVRLARGENCLARLAEALRDLTSAQSLDAAVGRAVKGLLGRIEEITLPVLGGGVKLRGSSAAANPHRDVFRLLVELCRLAHARHRLVLVRIDEVQHLHGDQLSQVLTVLGDALNEEVEERDAAGILRSRKLPLVVYLSGLPEFMLRANAARTTFSRRFKPIDLEPLEEADLREALAPFTGAGWPVLTDEGPARVHFSPEAVDLTVERCLGSPYLFQLVGDAAWNAGSGAVVSAEDVQRGYLSARREIRAYMELRLADLTEKQLAYLRAAASLPAGQRTAGRVAAQLGTTSEAVGYTAQALDERHRVIRRVAGKVVFRSAALEALLCGDLP